MGKKASKKKHVPGIKEENGIESMGNSIGDNSAEEVYYGDRIQDIDGDNAVSCNEFCRERNDPSHGGTKNKHVPGSDDEDTCEDGTDEDESHTSKNGMMAEAEAAYAAVVKTFNAGEEESSLLLCDSDENNRRYRGLLLGRCWADGATVEELVTARLQHDVAYFQVCFQLDTTNFKKKAFPLLSNKEILGELCKTVALLLKRYSGEEQLKFMFGEQTVNPRVVSALFNVGKRKNIRMIDVGIPYKTRVSMIDQCLEWCKPNRLVDISVAKNVYTKFVVDPTGEYSPVINLTTATDGFADHIRSIMERDYFDITMGITKRKEPQNAARTEKDRLPTVQIHQVNTDLTSTTVKFTVMVVHNFVSPVFMDKWIKRLNELCFTSGKAGKSNAFIRNCSTTTEPALSLLVVDMYMPVCFPTKWNKTY